MHLPSQIVYLGWCLDAKKVQEKLEILFNYNYSLNSTFSFLFYFICLMNFFFHLSSDKPNKIYIYQHRNYFFKLNVQL